MERSLFSDCLGVGSVVRYARKERGCLCTENSARQAIYNVGWFSGCANALPTAKTTLEVTLAHTGSSGIDLGLPGKINKKRKTWQIQ